MNLYDREDLMYFQRSLEEKLNQINESSGSILKILGSAGGPIGDGIGVDIRLLIIQSEIKELKKVLCISFSILAAILVVIVLLISLYMFHHW